LAATTTPGNDRAPKAKNPIFDGNNLSTFFDAPDANANNAWVGLDLGSPQTIAVIKYAPRAGLASRMVGGKFQVSSSADFSSGVVDLVTITTAPSEGTLTSVGVSPGGAYRYVRYLAPSGGYGNIAEMEVWGGSSGLPSPWTAGDIGTAANQAGSSDYNGATGTWTINGGGDDIWGTSDKFRYVYQDASGDCEIVARVTSVENTDYWAKAGVMIRESTAADSRYVIVAQIPNNGVSMQWRTSTGGSAAYDGGPVGGTASVKYVRLTRVGNKFRGYYKVNAGDNWTEMSTGQTGGGVDVTMAAATKIGLAVTAHTGTTATDANRINTSTFTNVTATP
jgi:hypothetical protein